MGSFRILGKKDLMPIIIIIIWQLVCHIKLHRIASEICYVYVCCEYLVTVFLPIGGIFPITRWLMPLLGVSTLAVQFLTAAVGSILLSSKKGVFFMCILSCIYK